VKEQSHKDEMSAALRGDFQRLRARGVSATLVPHESTAHAPEPVADDAAVRAEKPAPDDPPQASPPNVPESEVSGAGGALEAAATETPASEQSATPDEAPDAPDPDGGEEHAPPRSGWLSRLVGR
jgi:hypothetical protein